MPFDQFRSSFIFPRNVYVHFCKTKH